MMAQRVGGSLQCKLLGVLMACALVLGALGMPGAVSRAHALSNGVQISFAVKDHTFTYLRVGGKNQNGNWTTWQKTSSSGLRIALTENYWWKDTIVLVFDVVGVGRRSCIIDYLPQVGTMAAITYDTSKGCTGSGGSAIGSGSARFLSDSMKPDDSYGVVEAVFSANSATSCLREIAGAAAGSTRSRVMVIPACGGAALDQLNSKLRYYYNLTVVTK